MPRLALALTLAALLACGLWPARPVAGALAAGTIEDVDIDERSGFVKVRAGFRAEGVGTSRISVWVEVFDGPGGRSLGRRAERSDTNSCQEGRTCYLSLTTNVQIRAGECYVGWARSVAAGGAEEAIRRAPEGRRFCP